MTTSQVPLSSASISLSRKRIPVKSSDRKPGPYPYWGASGVVDHVDDFIFDHPALLVSEDGENLRSRKTPIAFLASGKYWVNNHAHVLVAAPGFDLRYLYYTVSTYDFDGHGLITGSGQPKLTGRALGSVPIRAVPLAEQQRIAGALGAFDDLIETNRRLAADLLSSLFLQVSVRGAEAPLVPFAEVAQRVTDRVKVSEMKPDAPYLGLEHFGTAGTGLVGRGTTASVKSASLAFMPGDVLYGKLRPYFRKVARPGFAGVCSGEIWVLRPSGGHSAAVVYATAHSQAFSDLATAGSGGTKMPRADWRQMAKFPTPDLRAILSGPEAKALDRLWEAASQLGGEADDLARQRDELLPLLMSGKVRVSELEGVA